MNGYFTIFCLINPTCIILTLAMFWFGDKLRKSGRNILENKVLLAYTNSLGNVKGFPTDNPLIVKPVGWLLIYGGYSWSFGGWLLYVGMLIFNGVALASYPII